MSDYSSMPASGGDSELQDFLMAEKQKAQVQAQVSVHTEPNFNVFMSMAFKNKSKIQFNLSQFLLFFLFRFMNSPKFVGIDVWTHRAVNLIAKPKHVYQIV